MISSLMDNLLLIFIAIMFWMIVREIVNEEQNKRWIDTIMLILIFGNLCFWAYGVPIYYAETQIAIILVIAVFMLWYVRINLKKSFLLTILLDALLLTMDYGVFLLIGYLSLESEMSAQQYEVIGILAYLLVKVILFFLLLLLGKISGKKAMEVMTDTGRLKYLLLFAFSIATISAMLFVYQYVKAVEPVKLFSFIALGMVGVNIVVFYLIGDILKRELKKKESMFLQIQAKNQLEMYRAISESFDNQKRKTHEYKNQMVCIESLLEKKQYSKLEEYVKKIYGSLNNELDAINTNNVMVNAILNVKYQEADAKGIVFVFRVNDLSELKINDEDVVTILSNLLNNAIEACETCENKKVIKFKFVKEDDLIIISVKNTFNYDIVYEDGEIKSKKTTDADEHGVGIKNILTTIEKYGGSYVIEDKNKEFYFSIIIPV